MDPSVLPPLPKIIPPRTVRIRADAFPFRADSPVHRCNCCFPFGRSKENSPWLRSNWAEPSIWKIPSVYSPVGNFTRLPRLWNYRCRCRIFKTDSSEDFWKSNRIGIGRGIFLKKKKNEIKYPEDIFDAIRIGVFFSFSIPEYSLDDFGDDDNFISLSRILSMKHFDRVNYLAGDATSKK